MSEKESQRCVGFSRFAAQRHPRFFQRFAAFPSITRRTRAHDVSPNMRAAAMPGDNMIESEVVRLRTAVLASEVVAAKHSAARQFQARPRTLHLVREPNHRGARKLGHGRQNIATAIHENFGLAADEEHYRAMRVTHIERFVILVEDENSLTHITSSISLSL